jgi:hypothetical protein
VLAVALVVLGGWLAARATASPSAGSAAAGSYEKKIKII